MKYHVEVTVEAPPETVWQILRDVENWSQWSPTIDRITLLEGRAGELGSRAKVEQPGLRPAVWTVDETVAGRSFGWSCSGAGYRIHAGHDIRPVGTDRAAVKLSIELTGALSGVLSLLVGKKTREYIDVEGASLKKVSEQTAAEARS
jgi:uncharacterized membrane protein